MITFVKEWLVVNRHVSIVALIVIIFYGGVKIIG